MYFSCSGDLNVYFEYSFDILNLLVVEKSIKKVLRALFAMNLVKKHKSPGRDLKNIFLPNKKHYSLVSEGNDNLFNSGPF